MNDLFEDRITRLRTQLQMAQAERASAQAVVEGHERAIRCLEFALEQLEAVRPPRDAQAKPKRAPSINVERAILDAMHDGPKSVDALTARLNRTRRLVTKALMRLRTKGLLEYNGQTQLYLVVPEQQAA